MRKIFQLLIIALISTIFSGCYFHVGWGTPVIVNNQQLQQPKPVVDSGYYRE